MSGISSFDTASLEIERDLTTGTDFTTVAAITTVRFNPFGLCALRPPPRGFPQIRRISSLFASLRPDVGLGDRIACIGGDESNKIDLRTSRFAGRTESIMQAANIAGLKLCDAVF